jgi:hypothetical protein
MRVEMKVPFYLALPVRESISWLHFVFCAYAWSIRGRVQVARVMSALFLADLRLNRECNGLAGLVICQQKEPKVLCTRSF